VGKGAVGKKKKREGWSAAKGKADRESDRKTRQKEAEEGMKSENARAAVLVSP